MKKLSSLILTLLCLTLIFCACEKITITVEYSATEGGEIIGEAIQSKEANDEGIANFDAVGIKASDGYRFIGWSDGNTDTYRADSLSQNASFTANFEKINYATITYSPSEGGIVGGNPVQTLEVGKTSSEVCAYPNEGYRFIGWSDGVESASRTDIVNGDTTITALFSNKVTISYTAGEGGKLLGATSQELAYGEKGTSVQAVSEVGYRFVCWSDGSTERVRYDIAGGEDIALSATFKKYYRVEFNCNSDFGTIAGTAIQEIFEGETSLPIIVHEKEGFEFVRWSDGSTSKARSVTPSEDVTLTALFVRTGYGLPVVSINTESGENITSKETYITCTIQVNDTEGEFDIIEATAQIRGRGNSTWDKFPKKPYKIKFDAKQDLFGYGKARDWVLLADYIDNSLIRNKIAYTVASEFEALSASPNCKSVEVYLNGEYRGVYLLCEQIEINKHRVEIEKDATIIDTAYLIEMDQWALDAKSTDVFVSVPDSLRSNRAYTIKTPDSDEITEEHKEFIRKYISDCINVLYNNNDYEKVKELIDVKSFAQAYIVYEMTKNPDVDYSSFYMYKDAGGTIKCGPVWDFDMSLGNAAHKAYGQIYGDPSSGSALFYARDKNPWFKGLLRFDEFYDLVCAELSEYAPKIEAKLKEIFEYTYSMQSAYEKNFEKWDVIGKNTWTNPDYIVEIESWKEHVEYCENYLKTALASLQKQYPAPTASE